jgi:transcriptional regulator with XRE-family HTH domain
MIKILALRLKELRIANRYTQSEVAKRLGISPTIISGYETGERTPSTDNLLVLSYLYRCSTDYLLGRSADKPETVINVEGLSPEHIEALKTLIHAMKNNKP